MLRVLRNQYLVHAHGSDPALFHEWVPEWMRQVIFWGMRGAQRMLVLARSWQDYYASVITLPSGTPTLFPNPAELPELIPDRTERLGMRLLFLGRIGAHKGAFDAIRAFAALPDGVQRSCSLTLAGDGEVDAAKRLGDQLGCASRCPCWVGLKEQKLIGS